MNTTPPLPELLSRIQIHLRADGVVRVSTRLRITDYDKRHAEWFSIGKDGSLYVQRGRSKERIGYPPNNLHVRIQFSQ